MLSSPQLYVERSPTYTNGIQREADTCPLNEIRGLSAYWSPSRGVY